MRFFILILTFSLNLTSAEAQEQKGYLLKSKAIGAQILFPKEPSSPLVDNGSVKTTTYDVQMMPADKDKNINYSLTLLDFPQSGIDLVKNKGQEDKFFNDMIKGGASNIGGTISSIKKIKHKDYTGREAQISVYDGGGVITSRVFLVGNRVYLIQVFTRKSNYPNSVSTKFLDSFELL